MCLQTLNGYPKFVVGWLNEKINIERNSCTQMIWNILHEHNTFWRPQRRLQSICMKSNFGTFNVVEVINSLHKFVTHTAEMLTTF